MVNGLGVLGWGVGGIEAEAAMLGQPMSMLIPQVVGFRLHGELPEGATATDLVLTVTEMLRAQGRRRQVRRVLRRPACRALPLADRATIGNMSPEFGSTCAIFPIDAETLRYLEFTGRPPEQIALVEAYAKEQGLWHDEHAEEPTFSDTVELDLGDVEPSLAGPKRPQDRVPLHRRPGRLPRGAGRPTSPRRETGRSTARRGVAETFPASDPPATRRPAEAGPTATPEPARGAATADRRALGRGRRRRDGGESSSSTTATS